MRWTVMPATGSCQLLGSPLSLTGSGVRSNGGSPISVSQPVGQGPLARNQAVDVRTIQEALNRVTVQGVQGGPMPFLAVDGICGPKTNAAIARFQQVQLSIFDGVIEPARKTITRLNEVLEAVTPEDVRARVSMALPLVSMAIAAAISNLEAVVSNGPATTGLAAQAADRLNRHFLLNTLSADGQSAARVDLFRSYVRYATVMTNTESIKIAAVDEFDLDQSDPKIALTFGKGFFEEGGIDPKSNRRLDRIHLGFGFFAPNVTPEFGAYIIIHELAHFVGHSDGRFIVDHGRGWFNDTFIKPLTADQRLTNAESYASFAHECRVGSPDRPAFVRTSPGGLGGAR